MLSNFVRNLWLLELDHNMFFFYLLLLLHQFCSQVHIISLWPRARKIRPIKAILRKFYKYKTKPRLSAGPNFLFTCMIALNVHLHELWGLLAIHQVRQPPPEFHAYEFSRFFQLLEITIWLTKKCVSLFRIMELSLVQFIIAKFVCTDKLGDSELFDRCKLYTMCWLWIPS